MYTFLRQSFVSHQSAYQRCCTDSCPRSPPSIMQHTLLPFWPCYLSFHSPQSNAIISFSVTSNASYVHVFVEFSIIFEEIVIRWQQISCNFRENLTRIMESNMLRLLLFMYFFNHVTWLKTFSTTALLTGTERVAKA